MTAAKPEDSDSEKCQEELAGVIIFADPPDAPTQKPPQRTTTQPAEAETDAEKNATGANDDPADSKTPPNPRTRREHVSRPVVVDHIDRKSVV